MSPYRTENFKEEEVIQKPKIKMFGAKEYFYLKYIITGIIVCMFLTALGFFTGLGFGAVIGTASSGAEIGVMIGFFIGLCLGTCISLMSLSRVEEVFKN